MKKRPPHYEVYIGADGRGYWRKVQANGKITADGSQGLKGKTPRAALNAAKRAAAKDRATPLDAIIREVEG